MTRAVLAGIFAGGASSRMGFPKGLLELRSAETILARWVRLFGDLGVATCLVGRRPEYAMLDLVCLEDAPPNVGPIGGLIALLRAAGEGHAVAVACDMPLVSPALLARLVHAESPAPAIAVRRGEHWEPFFARYDAPRCVRIAEDSCAAGVHSLARLLDALHTESLLLTPSEERKLDDWDTPADRARRPA